MQIIDRIVIGCDGSFVGLIIIDRCDQDAPNGMLSCAKLRSASSDDVIINDAAGGGPLDMAKHTYIHTYYIYIPTDQSSWLEW